MFIPNFTGGLIMIFFVPGLYNTLDVLGTFCDLVSSNIAILSVFALMNFVFF